MTVNQAAAKREVEASTIYDLCRHGLLGHARIGVGRGVIRISQADIDDYLERASVRPASAAPDDPETEPELKHLRL